VEGGAFREAAVRELLTAHPYPARNPAANIADLKAQAGANARGAEDLRAMAAEFGLETVTAYMEHVQDYAEEAVRRAIGVLHDGSFTVKPISARRSRRHPRQSPKPHCRH
jgi:5-oxoprolinase (ATP-hydrolysing)